MFDIIGDVHGQADKLVYLLEKMGYSKTNTHYYHRQRKAVFVGDLIDRGSKVRETLQIVKAMTDNHAALCIMGNHEYNALLFHYRHNSGFLRKHSTKHIKQHSQTLRSFHSYHNECKMYLNWFRTLPLFIDKDGFRVVHASWNNTLIDYARQHMKRFDDKTLLTASTKGTMEYTVIEQLLKGFEIDLPEGEKFTDKDNIQRDSIRIKWWEKHDSPTYRSMSIHQDKNLTQETVPKEKLPKSAIYPADAPPIFFGHYWQTGTPRIMQHNVCCLDYSAGKGDKLVAYQWDGERELNNKKFIYTE